MPDETPPSPPPDPRRIARRALLRRGAYLVPAVLGTFVVSRGAEAASCLPSCSCGPNCCFPDVRCFPWFANQP